MSKPQIAPAVGSTRPGRFADRLAAWLQELTLSREDLQMQALDLRKYPLPFFEEAGPPEAAPPANDVERAWANALSRCDGFILLTPEYNHGPPAELKSELDYACNEWANPVTGHHRDCGIQLMLVDRQWTITLQRDDLSGGSRLVMAPQKANATAKLPAIAKNVATMKSVRSPSRTRVA